MKKGFTLVELLVSITLLTIIIGALIAVFNMGRHVYEANEGMLSMQRIIRQSLEGMATEIRQSSLSDITVGGGGTTISFIVPVTLDPLAYSSSIEYYVDGNNQLVREHPNGTTKILATNIDSISFTVTGDIVDVVVQGTVELKNDDLNFTINKRITLRS